MTEMTDQEMDEMLEHNKKYFLHYWAEIADRPGADSCLDWLWNETDFFTAPASTKYHGAHPGGLLVHSINVCEELLTMLDAHDVKGVERQSAILVALLHDVCKCNYYQEAPRRQRNPKTGKWEDVRGYITADTLPLGHGEKSAIMLMRTGLFLSEEELAAIRWHMGAYHDQDRLNTMGQAFDRWPLALFLHLADMVAAHYIEVED